MFSLGRDVRVDTARSRLVLRIECGQTLAGKPADSASSHLISSSSSENPGVGGPTSTFNKLLAAGDRGGAFEAVGKEIPTC